MESKTKTKNKTKTGLLDTENRLVTTKDKEFGVKEMKEGHQTYSYKINNLCTAWLLKSIILNCTFESC